MQNKTSTIVLVVVILLALGLVTYWFLQRGKTPTGPEVPTPVTPETPGPELPTQVFPETPTSDLEVPTGR